MANSKLVRANERIAETVVGGYKKIEDGVTGALKKVEDSFVGKFLTHEGETVEDAEKRLAGEQRARTEASQKYGAPLIHGPAWAKSRCGSKSFQKNLRKAETQTKL